MTLFIIKTGNYFRLILLQMKIKFFYWIFLFTSFSALNACQKEEGYKNINSFYFPLEELKNGLVYEYQPLNNDSLTPIYWYYKTHQREDTTYLTGTYYEYGLIPFQVIIEELLPKGMWLNSLLLNETDSIGQQQQTSVEVIAGTTFPFEVRDSGGVFLYKVRWTTPANPNVTTTLIKNRRYLGETTYSFGGKEHECVLFDVKELFEYDDKKEGYFEQELDGFEVYAKNIGLVYYRKGIGETVMLEYGLHDRYTMEELEDQFTSNSVIQQ